MLATWLLSAPTVEHICCSTFDGGTCEHAFESRTFTEDVNSSTGIFSPVVVQACHLLWYLSRDRQ